MRVAFLLLFVVPGGASDLIDRRVAERWDAEGVRPAAVADDYEFFRRLSIDLRGAIPEPAEIRSFAADRDPAKREKLVDAWLKGEAFAKHWASRWTEDLTLHPASVQKMRDAAEGFRGWLRDAVRSNMTYDRFVRRLLTSSGPTDLDPAAGFLVMGLTNGDESAKDVTERTARIFLGVQVRCAECHDHPFDDWTQQDFYGLASFFSQSRPQGTRGAGKNGSFTGWIEDDPARGDARFGDSRKGASVPPRYRSGGAAPLEGESRRAAFARLLTADRQFARAAVNRHWGMLLGRGLVHPLDGFTATRKASHPELLEELADDFAASKFDVRRLMKSILLSKPYQLSSKSTAPDRIFARALVAPMPPDQLFDSILLATGVDQTPSGRGPKGAPVHPRDAFLHEFRPSFLGNDVAPPAGAEATIAQALWLLNSEYAGRATSAAPSFTLGRILAREQDPAKRVEELFLCTVSRPPTAKEAAALIEGVRTKGDRAEAYEDIFWALLNSTEFVTRH